MNSQAYLVEGVETSFQDGSVLELGGVGNHDHEVVVERSELALNKKTLFKYVFKTSRCRRLQLISFREKFSGFNWCSCILNKTGA